MNIQTNTLCKVKNCKFSQHHVTFGHKCGKCGDLGHGQIECGNNIRINILNKYKNDILPDYLYCKRPKCTQYSLHTTQSHMCLNCNGFHSEYNCKNSLEFIQRKEAEQLIKSDNNIVDILEFEPNTPYDIINDYFVKKYAGIDGKIYKIIHAGLGCFWICKRDSIGEMIELHFSHSDDIYIDYLVKIANDFIIDYKEII